MESKINETLLDKLFRNPAPLDRKKQIFFYLHERMFPCKKVIEDFLQSVDDGERTERAKYIIERLCFEANFPPPYFLLSNLLDFERSDKNKSSERVYIPQDHFSHIVYTYLLGLYLFFYSPSVNRALTKEFMRKRAETSYDPVLDATKDFLSFWKYFCLFHDIAYPIEQSYIEKEVAAPGTGRTIELKDQDAYGKYLEKFNHMKTILSREILLEGAAKYLVVQQMYDDYNNQLFEDVLKPLEGCFVKKEESTVDISIEEVKGQFGQYKSIDKIHCFEHLKMFTGFIPPENYIIVLFDAFSERPVAIKDKPKSNTPAYYLLKSKYNITPEMQIIKLLDHEDYLLDEGFFVRYYFKDLDFRMKDAGLKKETGRMFKLSDYYLILSKIQDLPAFKDQKPEPVQYFERITTNHDLNSYIFQCYKALSKYVEEMCPPIEKLPLSSTEMTIEHNKKIIQKYLRVNFINVFKNAVVERLSFSDFKTAGALLGDMTSSTISEEYIGNVVKKAVNVLFDEKLINEYIKDVTEKFKTDILEALEKEKNANGLISMFICQCNKKLFSNEEITKCDPLQVFQTDGVHVDSLLDTLKGSEHLSNVTKYLNEKLGSSSQSKMEFVEFVKKYKTSNYIYDHGIYGACIFLFCFQYYEEVIARLFDSTETKVEFTDIMSTLCWNVEKNKYANKLSKDYEHVTSAVFKSIFCHNLYPDVIRELYKAPTLEWKYNLLKEPSTYFGMMVDALQVWNRNKYYQHSQIDWWPRFSSDYYDVVIEQNKIVIKLKTYSKDIDQVIDKFLSEKDTYLKDFSTFVTVDIVHT